MPKQKSKDWELYLSRPFTLFGASLWHEWYSSELGSKILGGDFVRNGLYIENPPGIVRHYRIKSEIAEFWKAVEYLAVNNPEKYKRMLEKGVSLNKEAERMLREGSSYDLKQTLEFLIKIALLATVFPYRSGTFSSKIKDKKILSLIKELRSVSYYPRVISEIVIPAAVKELKKMNIVDRKAIDVITVQEILKKKKVNIKKRLLELKQGKTYIYENLVGKEKIRWTKNPSALIGKIEKTRINNQKIIKGNTTFKGKTIGEVRLILTNKITSKEFDKFDKGNVLVAISTSPNLMPLIKKCGAIITDEGGTTSHAAIISRELKKPCIIGTKIATKVLKDGDMVEVDANKGVVRILKQHGK